MELTILMPCLNEGKTIEVCIQKAKRFICENGIDGEVLISDNGSTDDSVAIAQRLGAHVVRTSVKGYGSALLNGIEHAKGKYVIMGDADDSYNFTLLMPYVDKLREGYDLVIGNRYKGGIKKKAMPFLHRYLGNPVISFLGRLFFKTKLTDYNCGLRGFDKNKILDLQLLTPGMEFASEMIVRSAMSKYKIVEVPTTLDPDGRDRAPHLRTWRDGWRHLTFMLLYSPRWLFLYPGILIFMIFSILFFYLLIKPIVIGNITLDIHTMTLAGFGVIGSFQVILFAFLSKIYATNHGFLPENPLLSKLYTVCNLERGIIAGFGSIIVGLLFIFKTYLFWENQNFGHINSVNLSFRTLIPGAVFCLLGVQLIFSSFFFRLLGIKKIK